MRGILVTEGVRGDGGVLRNSEGKRFMFDYVADMFRAETADTEEEADRWYDDHINNRRTPDLLPRDEVARAINSEVKAGRGTPARRRLPRHRHRAARAEYIRRRLPSMYHQFMELAGVDITADAHGGRPDLPLHDGRRAGRRRDRRRPPSRASSPPARSPGGMHGANRLGGNSLSDLIVFGRRAGIGAADFAEGRAGSPSVDAGRGRRRRSTRPSPRSGARTARTPTTSSTSCRRRCRPWSASSAPGPSSKRRWASSRSSTSAHGQGRR